MPYYIYQARDKKGKSKKGRMFSSSEHALAQILERQGLLLTFCKKIKKGKLPKRQQVTKQEIIDFLIKNFEVEVE